MRNPNAIWCDGCASAAVKGPVDPRTGLTPLYEALTKVGCSHRLPSTTKPMMGV